MCDDKIKNLAINVPLRKTKLLTTKQRSGPYQVLIININFLLCVLVWYNQEFHEEYSQTWSCSIKEAFFRSLETSFVKALYQISVSFYMTHYLIGASRALAIGGSLACFTKPANTALFPCFSPLRMFRGRCVCVWPQKFDTDDVDMSGIWSTGTDWSTFIFSNSTFFKWV